MNSGAASAAAAPLRARRPVTSDLVGPVRVQDEPPGTVAHPGSGALRQPPASGANQVELELHGRPPGGSYLEE
jgi:hypothetical protein